MKMEISFFFFLGPSVVAHISGGKTVHFSRPQFPQSNAEKIT